MPYHRAAGALVVAQDFFLDIGVGFGNPLVLAQVLGPGFDLEPLQHQTGVGRVFGDAPGVGTVAPPLGR